MCGSRPTTPAFTLPWRDWRRKLTTRMGVFKYRAFAGSSPAGRTLLERISMDIKKFGRTPVVGDVFQIVQCGFDPAYDGCLVLAIEIGSGGILGEISYPSSILPDGEEISEVTQVTIPLRLKWTEIEYVGLAPLIPTD